MPVRMLDWSLFGSEGVDITSGMTVDTGGVAVTVDFLAQDEGAAARNFELGQYVAPGENFDPTEGLKLFGAGGEGGSDDTSVTTISFASSDAMFGDAVTDVSFRINDLDLGQGGQDYTDIVTIRAYDAEGNLVDVTLTPGSDILVSGDTATGNDASPAVTPPTDPDTSLLVEIAGPVTRIEIDYNNGGTDEQAIWVTDIEFSTTAAGELTANDDVIVTDEDSTGMVIATANDTDPEGDDIEIVSVDTTGLNGDVTIAPDNDTLIYDPNGQYESLGTGDTATETFTYTVTDGNGNTDTATVTVTINGVNDAPDAVDDSAEIPVGGSSVIVPVLANDSDPESDPLTITGISDPANGSVVDNGDGTVTYTPTPGFAGTDTFTYTIEDPEGASDTATVTVTVGGPAPDGYVDGDDDPNLIDDMYTGDPNGDMVDDNDALLPGEVGNDDIIRAGGGDDTVEAGDGDDEVFGGDGNDSVNGDVGNDDLMGEMGNDTLNGEEGDDTAEGGAGDDSVIGGDGNDSLDGGTGDDTIEGGAGNGHRHGRRR